MNATDTTAQTSEAPGGDYAARNRALFERRIALQERKARHLARREQAKAARVGREIEEVTSEIIQFNYGLVRSYVSRFTSHTSAEDSADFESAALVGLMRAITTYDPDQGSFAQWAFRPIKREVLSAVRHADHANMTPGDFERRPQILRANAKLTVDGVAPSLEAVAAEADVPIEQVTRVLHAPRVGSLSLIVGDDGSDSSLSDMIPDDSPEPLDQVVRTLSVSALETWGLTVLEPRELFVIVRRFGLDGEPAQRLSTIGDALGLSRETARQIQGKALARLSHPITLRRLVRHHDEIGGDAGA